MKEKITDLGFIYCLINPLDETTFYVGATERLPKDRLTEHYLGITEREHEGLHLTTVQQYLKDLLPTKAIVKIIEIVINEDLFAKEREYIREFRQYHDLKNTTVGGMGGNTWSLRSKEQQQVTSLKLHKALIGRTKPPGFKEALSKARKGTGNPACKISKYGMIILKTEDSYRLFKYGFEICDFCENPNAWSNIVNLLLKWEGEAIGYGYQWYLYNKCSPEIQQEAEKNYQS